MLAGSDNICEDIVDTKSDGVSLVGISWHTVVSTIDLMDLHDMRWVIRNAVDLHAFRGTFHGYWIFHGIDK